MSQNRRVVANITISLDGRTTGPEGPYDMSWIGPHAVTDQARDGAVRMTNATTVLLGRANYEGFGGYWPTVARDNDAEPRDRALGQWLDRVEKVVFSSTLTGPTWENSRITSDDPAEVVKRLRGRTAETSTCSPVRASSVASWRPTRSTGSA